MSDSWYEVVPADVPLTQGDLVLACPVLKWRDRSSSNGTPGNNLKDVADAVSADVVVMTQACDLQQQKVENVILCPHLPLSEHKALWEETMRLQHQNPNAKAWKTLCGKITQGSLWNLTILNCLEEGDLQTEHRIVDFHEVFSVPRSFIESLLLEREQSRLRLLPPYREHLSQAFARFFMRVGLPVDVKQTW